MEALLLPREDPEHCGVQVYPSLGGGFISSCSPKYIKEIVKDYKRMLLTVDIRLRENKNGDYQSNYSHYTTEETHIGIVTRMTGDSYIYRVRPFDEYLAMWNEMTYTGKKSLLSEVSEYISILSSKRNAFPAFAIMELYLGREVTHILRYRASTISILAPTPRCPFISLDGKPFVPLFRIYNDIQPLFELINSLLPKEPGLFSNPGKEHYVFWAAWKELMEKTAW